MAGKTLGDWDKHFNGLTGERRVELAQALLTLESDPMLKAEFGWTCLFALKYSMDYQTCVDAENKARGIPA